MQVQFYRRIDGNCIAHKPVCRNASLHMTIERATMHVPTLCGCTAKCTSFHRVWNSFCGHGIKHVHEFRTLRAASRQKIIENHGCDNETISRIIHPSGNEMHLAKTFYITFYTCFFLEDKCDDNKDEERVYV